MYTCICMFIECNTEQNQVQDSRKNRGRKLKKELNSIKDAPKNYEWKPDTQNKRYEMPKK